MRALRLLALWLSPAAAFQAAPLRAQSVEWKTFAGNYGGAGIRDGQAAQSRFDVPRGMAPDGTGGVYVTDLEKHTIRRISSAGVVSTLTGNPGVNGDTDGPAGTALLNRPHTLFNTGAFLYALDATPAVSAGRLRQISFDGTVSTLADAPEGISGIAALPDGTLYLSYASEHVIRRRTPAGAVSIIAGKPGTSGSDNGEGGGARFNFPGALTLDKAGNLIVSDTRNYLLRKMTPEGVVSTLAGSVGKSGSADGAGTAATFSGITAMTVDDSGDVFASGGANGNIRRISPTGVVTTLAGGSTSVHGWKDGVGRNASFADPAGIAFAGDGSLMIADAGAQSIRRMTPDLTVTTYAGRPSIRGILDGAGTAAQMLNLRKSAVDTGGNIYFIDGQRIRKSTPQGVVTTLAGDPWLAGSANGTGTAARFNNPVGVTVDNAGTVYVADTGNHTIRKITPARVVSTLAGRTGESGALNGTGGAARFELPNDVTIGPDGALYVTDYNRAVRKVTTAGVVTTYAGILGSDGTNDGPIDSARFLYLAASAFDVQGNLYVLDSGAHNIRKVSADRTQVTTLCGLAGEAGYADGTGPAARFDQPFAVDVAPDSVLYVADLMNNVVRRITPAGAVTTVGGLFGDKLEELSDGVGSEARFSGLTGISIDSKGSIYLSDADNARLVKGTVIQSVELTAVPQTVTFAEDTTYPLLLETTGAGGGTVSFTVVTPPAHGTLSGAAPNLVYTPATDYFGPDTFTFKAVSGSTESAPATVSITVTNVNDPPVAFDRTITTDEDTAVQVPTAGFDAESEIDERSFEVLTQPAHGKVTGSAPNLYYKSDADYSGPDSFTYVARDYTSTSAPAVITINVLPVNDAPAAAAQTLETNEDTSLPVVLTGTDAENDPLTFEVAAPPAHGTLTGNAPNLVYTPAADYFGPDSFSFIARDGTLASAAVQVALTVRPVNDPPTVLEPLEPIVQTRPGLTASIPLAPHFRDPETGAEALTFSLQAENRADFFISSMQGGILTLTGTTPGIANVTVIAADPEGLSAESVFIYRVKHLPELTGGSGIPAQRAILGKPPVLIDLSSWFSDADGDLLTFSLAANSNPVPASVTLTGPLLTLIALEPGSTRITVRATDSDGGTLDAGFDLAAGTEFPTATATGGLVPDPQSGLLLQKVTIVNTTGLAWNGFRLLVSGLPDGTALHNTTAPAGASGSWIDWTGSMEPGAQATLTLAFYSPARIAGLTPVLSVGDVGTATQPLGDGKGLEVRLIASLKDGGILLEFDSIPGHWYQVEYSTDFTTWKVSPVSIRTSANRTQWIDRGPPWTDAPPSGSPARIYRIKDATPAPF
ncbi:MAG: repeat containing protein [Verrucomicrobiales bacterium]|nr:repeat containing protein [Verrucomicrobiales bacterium]